MPYRRTPLAPGEVYHVFNRSIASQPDFRNQKDYQRIIDVTSYYRFKNLPLRFSHYNRLSQVQKDKFNKNYIFGNKPMLDIIAYSIMPNHFHFLLQPFISKAISDFMRNMQNSYSKYFNTKYDRTGSLFQFMFKAVHIENEEQLIHVSRYIHLNPVTAYLLEVDQLERYSWSSFKDYLSDKGAANSFVNPNLVLSQFQTRGAYKKFVFDQVDYQRELDKIKHLTLEYP